jgi:mannose-6-phosphate isomerase-like protein (cupin superfamily)
MEDIKPFQVERPWGNFRQFTLNTLSTVKILTILPHQELSLQSHAKRGEFVRVLRGEGTLEIGNEKHDIKEGEEYFIPVGTRHRIAAGPLGLVYLEIAMGTFDENDEVRYEDKYGRA